MGYHSVGGQWPPLRFSNEQMVSIRCAESHPAVKVVDRCNPQELSVVTRKRVARHGYPLGDLLLPFGQFTSCRACGDEAAGVPPVCNRCSSFLFSCTML